MNSMTDITELATAMKAAAKKLKEVGIIHNYSKSMAAQIDFEKSATPDNILALVEALEKAQRVNNSAPTILRQLAEEKQKRGEVAAATAFNYAASALQKELSK
ncbi:Uncharacterised protein [Raoultella planticola]|uniref:Uncharacterized protein n=1 Tax=Raoultella planticola TaxID=575 RepID=A0A8G2E947_RAOPL|nr:hypothetical protein [Raoultella planticola]SAP76345.1 Uncharacterised protein [Raoultella planticola]